MADGGRVEQATAFGDLPRLGRLSRLEEVLIEEDVDTVLVASAESDRAEFFRALDTCHEYGVSVLAHRAHANHVIKRAFDVAFVGEGLLVLSPVITVIAVAIKLDSLGLVLYSQDRTAEFGEMFTVYKFRSMVPDAEAKTGVKLSEEDAGGVDSRVTRVGKVGRILMRSRSCGRFWWVI